MTQYASTPQFPTIDELLSQAIAQNASDLMLSANTPPQVKVNGSIQNLSPEIYEHSHIQTLLRSICSEEQWKQFETDRDLDMAYTYVDDATGTSARFRVNLGMQRNSPFSVMRAIPTLNRQLEDFKFHDIVPLSCVKPRGLILVTGPTGSGKSTTLAAMINYINRKRRVHILTLEDPIEFTHENILATVNQREVGRDTRSFASGLRAALREAPDVILVGEMRDPETMSAALTAAETGHLVMGTLHTNGAAETIDRIIDAFSADKRDQIKVQLANNLRMVISQTLVPRVDGSGREIAYEIMGESTAIKALIRDGKAYQIGSILQTSGKKEGMVALDSMLADLVYANKVTIEAATERCVDVKELTEAIDKLRGRPSSASTARK